MHEEDGSESRYDAILEVLRDVVNNPTPEDEFRHRMRQLHTAMHVEFCTRLAHEATEFGSVDSVARGCVELNGTSMRGLGLAAVAREIEEEHGVGNVPTNAR